MTTFLLTADKPEYKPNKHIGKKDKKTKGNHQMCPFCPKLQECQERVKIGMWVMCEIPDELDMMRIDTARAA